MSVNSKYHIMRRNRKQNYLYLINKSGLNDFGNINSKNNNNIKDIKNPLQFSKIRNKENSKSFLKMKNSQKFVKEDLSLSCNLNLNSNSNSNINFNKTLNLNQALKRLKHKKYSDSKNKNEARNNFNLIKSSEKSPKKNLMNLITLYESPLNNKRNDSNLQMISNKNKNKIKNINLEPFANEHNNQILNYQLSNVNHSSVFADSSGNKDDILSYSVSQSNRSINFSINSKNESTNKKVLLNSNFSNNSSNSNAKKLNDERLKTVHKILDFNNMNNFNLNYMSNILDDLSNQKNYFDADYIQSKKDKEVSMNNLIGMNQISNSKEFNFHINDNDVVL